MTKARARERAKAKAADKAKKRATMADQSGQDIPPGRFDPRQQAGSSPGATANTKSFSAGKRGSARSR